MDLNQLVEKGYSLKNQIDQHEEEVKNLNEELKKTKNQILEVMKLQNLSSMKHACGTVVVTSRFSVKNPATDEDKKMFYDYLRGKGIFEEMVSVHSAKLTSWYKAEMEVAKQDGNFGFKIPGIGDPTAFEDITFRKG